MTGGDEQSDEEGFIELLEDPYARAVLVETRKEPRSAEELSEAIDVAPSTVYRRIERLSDQDLVEADQQLDPGGHHYKEYRARLERVTLELTADGFDVKIDRSEKADPADEFTRLYEGLSSE